MERFVIEIACKDDKYLARVIVTLAQQMHEKVRDIQPSAVYEGPGPRVATISIVRQAAEQLEGTTLVEAVDDFAQFVARLMEDGNAGAN